MDKLIFNTTNEALNDTPDWGASMMNMTWNDTPGEIPLFM